MRARRTSRDRHDPQPFMPPCTRTMASARPYRDPVDQVNPNWKWDFQFPRGSSVRLGMSLRLEDYALIGDTETAALVGTDGSIDWLCLPRFDSGACCAALLGDVENGRWLIGPTGDVRDVRRRYRDGTLVLETEFTTDEGVVRVVDCMPRGKITPTWYASWRASAVAWRCGWSSSSGSTTDAVCPGCATWTAGPGR